LEKKIETRRKVMKELKKRLLIASLFLLGFLAINYFTSNYLGFYILPVWIKTTIESRGYEISGVLAQVYNYEGSCYSNADYKLMVGENLAYYLKDSDGILKGCVGKSIILRVSNNPVGKCHNSIAEANIYEVISLNSPCINI